MLNKNEIRLLIYSLQETIKNESSENIAYDLTELLYKLEDNRQKVEIL